MNNTIKKLITAGVLIATAGGGYIVADIQGLTEDRISYTWEEKELVVMLWDEMLETKKANCDKEVDCEIIDGKPYVMFQNLTKKQLPEKMLEKIGEYDIKLIKKKK